ncbi:MAG: 30S ribosomal protein S6 [Desulfarculus sp.]|nr:MAG: 30S ribosomal protein S6 [Desulfarculus sp.]
MRHYETIFIIHPELGDEETAAVVEKFSGILEAGGAFMVRQDHWGRRRLAYAVKKQSKGYYVLFEYGAEAPAVAEMERNFKIDEQIMRFITVKIGDSFDLEVMKQAKAEAEAKAAARAQAAQQSAQESEEDVGLGRGLDDEDAEEEAEDDDEAPERDRD